MRDVGAQSASQSDSSLSASLKTPLLPPAHSPASGAVIACAFTTRAGALEANRQRTSNRPLGRSASATARSQSWRQHSRFLASSGTATAASCPIRGFPACFRKGKSEWEKLRFFRTRSGELSILRVSRVESAECSSFMLPPPRVGVQITRKQLETQLVRNSKCLH